MGMMAGYEIGPILDQGSMGRVYRARRPGDEDYGYAIKILSVPGNSEFAARFHREAGICAQLDHPSILKVYETSSAGDEQLFMVMELAHGGSLRDRLQNGPLAIDKGLFWMTQVTEALQEAHRLQIIHRDVKPENIMVFSEERVKLADFGLARQHGGEQLTVVGTKLGTAAYVSPEQIGDPSTVDGRSDLYSLGATFYEVFTGASPFDARTTMELLMKQMNEQPEDPACYREELPAVLRSLLLRLLQKEPESRPQSTQEVLDFLARIS